jgi:hypothetical protein
MDESIIAKKLIVLARSFAALRMTTELSSAGGVLN